jgi:lipoate-protein ligase A
VCFENPSDFEITVTGKKIIGSAQARKKSALLQHGSLPLIGDLRRITQVLTYPSPEERIRAGELLLEKAATVSGVLGQEVSWHTAARAFEEAFSHTLNLDLQAGEITQREAKRARTLAETQFGSLEWTRGTQTTLSE